MKIDGNGNVSLYVYDLIIIGSDTKFIDEIKRKLSSEFEMKDLGYMYYCLGIKVWREYGKTLITQSNYMKELIRRFNISECSPIPTPLG
jgi:hypothetical protein